ncbi:hypothetical protein G3A_19545 [Bacillus sp. 17376]|nr:hypothetical protein G3A_19545 [Bacillus sp. 17376]
MVFIILLFAKMEGLFAKFMLLFAKKESYSQKSIVYSQMVNFYTLSAPKQKPQPKRPGFY